MYDKVGGLLGPGFLFRCFLDGLLGSVDTVSDMMIDSECIVEHGKGDDEDQMVYS